MRNRRLTVDNCRGKRAVSCAQSKKVQTFSSDSGIDRKHVKEIAEEYKDRQQRDREQLDLSAEVRLYPWDWEEGGWDM